MSSQYNSRADTEPLTRLTRSTEGKEEGKEDLFLGGGVPGPRPPRPVTAAQPPPTLTLRYDDSDANENTASVDGTTNKSKDERFYDAYGITQLPNGKYMFNNEEMSRLPGHMKALYQNFK